MLINGIKGQRDHAIASAKSNFEFFIEKHSFSKDYLQAAPLNMYEVDPNGKTLWANQATLDTLGLTLDEYINKTYIDFSRTLNIPYEICQEFMDDDNRVVQSGKPIINKEEPCNVLPDGRVKYFLTSRWPIFCDRSQKVIAVFGVSRDITEIRLREIDNISSFNAYSDYITRESHDASNELEDINFLMSAFSDRFNPDSKEYTEMKSFIDCISLSQKRCRNIACYREAMDAQDRATSIMPYKLLDMLEQRFDSVARLRKNKVIKVVDESCGDFELVADTDLILSLLTNLTSNALKSMREGMVCIKISSKLEKSDCGKKDIFWILEVFDSGVGLGKDKMKYLESNDGVYETDSKRKGLSLVKKIAHEHLGGTINCSSSVNFGTKISVSFKGKNFTKKRLV